MATFDKMPTSIIKPAGETYKVDTGLPDYINQTEVTWSSTNSVVASVTGGVISFKSPGGATISASYGGTNKSCDVVVGKKYDDATITVLQNAFQAGWSNYTDAGVGLQCVTLSRWFLATYTTQPWAFGNGANITKNTAEKSGLATTSKLTGVPSLYSVEPGNGSYGGGDPTNGHTGIILSADIVDGEGEVTYIDSSNRLSGKTPNSNKVKDTPYPPPTGGLTLLVLKLK